MSLHLKLPCYLGTCIILKLYVVHRAFISLTDTKGVRANKNKKKNRRKKDQAKNSSSSEPGSNSKVGVM